MSEKRESGMALKKRESTPESGTVDTYDRPLSRLPPPAPGPGPRFVAVGEVHPGPGWVMVVNMFGVMPVMVRVNTSQNLNPDP